MIAAVASNKEATALAKLTKICLALPESQRRIHGDHADFRVRCKVFAYYLNDHHGDGIVSVCCKTSLGENVDRVAGNPERFYLPAYIGPREMILDGGGAQPKRPRAKRASRVSPPHR